MSRSGNSTMVQRKCYTNEPQRDLGVKWSQLKSMRMSAKWPLPQDPQS